MFFIGIPVFGLVCFLFLSPPQADASNPIESKRKYIGEEYDIETNLNYLNARYYDASRGQFISQDPQFWNLTPEYLFDPQQLNSYSYARNNPINWSDPLGLSSASVFGKPPGGWTIGQRMGQFNGVTAYYNGIGSSSIAYSCVEYVKRYMSYVYGINSIGRVGDARTMWNMSDTINSRLTGASSDYRFNKYPNGMNALPRAGDLLFWTEGKYGHVMVVTESNVGSNSQKGYVEVIDQNASSTAVRKLDVTKTDTGYTITRNSGSRAVPVAGWFSPALVKKEGVPSNAFVWRQGTGSPSTNVRQPLLRRVLDSAGRILNSIF